jgi:SynChlorMet cassette protein ScmD
MVHDNNPIANSLLVPREEFADWAVLFDPDTGESFGFNPVCVFIFKRLDGKHTLDNIMNELRAECKNAPADAEKHVRDFRIGVKSLISVLCGKPTPKKD